MEIRDSIPLIRGKHCKSQDLKKGRRISFRETLCYAAGYFCSSRARKVETDSYKRPSRNNEGSAVRLRDCVDRLGKHGEVINGSGGKCCKGKVVLYEHDLMRAILPAVKHRKCIVRRR